MPPDQKPTTETPTNFDFILQSTQPKKSKLSFGKSSGQRILVVIVAVLILIALIYVFLSIVRSQNNKGNGQLVDLAAYQTELARVVSLGVSDAQTTAVKANAETATLSITSDLIQTKTFIKKKGISVGPTELNKYLTSSIDDQLKTAKAANNYDAVFSQLVDEKLDSYKTKLADVFAAQTKETIKNGLRTFKAHAELLPFSYNPL